jgi:hypothetical protein
MALDEIEANRAINKLREIFKELENPLLQEVLDSMLDLIESAHERITEMAPDDDE